MSVMRFHGDGTPDESFADRGTFTIPDVPVTADTGGFGGVFQDDGGAIYISFMPVLREWRVCKLTP